MARWARVCCFIKYTLGKVLLHKLHTIDPSWPNVANPCLDFSCLLKLYNYIIELYKQIAHLYTLIFVCTPWVCLSRSSLSRKHLPQTSHLIRRLSLCTLAMCRLRFLLLEKVALHSNLSHMYFLLILLANFLLWFHKLGFFFFGGLTVLLMWRGIM